MSTRIFKIARGLVQSMRAKPSREVVDFQGTKLVLSKGAWRAKVDKDDAWYSALVRRHRIVFDIGANVGYTAILANLYGPPDKLVLIDPNPEAISIAAANLISNNLSMNCIFYPAFVGDRDDDKIKFWTIGTGAAGSMYSSHAHTAVAINSYRVVNTITLDRLIKLLELSPDLVKIDVEGAELLVLRGAAQLAAKNNTVFFVEMHSKKEMSMKSNGDNVIEFCNQFGYKVYYLKDHIRLTDSSAIAHRGKCHLLLIPAGMEYPAYLMGIKEGSALPHIDQQ